METAAPTDAELLADWLNHRREAAFHALVSRYAALVHMAAKRACGDDSMAAEASQLTFILLARKAKSLGSRSSLGGWLHLTAVGEAKNLLRASRRESRKRAQLHTAMDTPTQSPPGNAWQEMQPVLNDALAALSDKDREALLLRFYRSLSVREVAATLGIATDAAQKRIDRATERLRDKLTRRGVQTRGTLSAAMLTGFAADAQAALPISVLASKAIAAGAVSSFSFAAIFTTIITLMKTSPWIPPVTALLVAGVWTGTKYQSLAALKQANADMRDQIVLAQPNRTSTPVKTPNEESPINWEKLATEKENGPEFQRFYERLKSMAREELTAALDRIVALQCSKDRRDELDVAVAFRLEQIDPECLLKRFQTRLADDPDRSRLNLQRAFQAWAKKDLIAATAWFDSQIAAGSFDGKQLDEDRRSQSRIVFEASLMALLLETDSAAAVRRFGVLPEAQRQQLIQCLSTEIRRSQLKNEQSVTFADFARSQLPTDQQALFIASCAPNISAPEEFPKINAYMDAIQATPAERMFCAESSAGSCIRILSGRRKVTMDDIGTLRGHFASIAPDEVDAMTARSFARAIKGRHSSMLFPQASRLAMELLETSGNQAVLATFLEIANYDEADKTLARGLAEKISDETRRTAILKRFK